MKEEININELEQAAESTRYLPRILATLGGEDGVIAVEMPDEQSFDEGQRSEVHQAADEVANFLRIEGGAASKIPGQVLMDMCNVLSGYLGSNWQQFNESKPKPPRNYHLLVDRLSRYFYTTDKVAVEFGSFERRHLDPKAANPTGPRQDSQRMLSSEASQRILRQLQNFYGIDFTISLIGQREFKEDCGFVWAPGVAECQFLLLDRLHQHYSLMEAGKSELETSRTMSLENIASNIQELISHREIIIGEISSLNSILGSEVTQLLDNLRRLTATTFYRGRPDQPVFMKYPIRAEAIIRQIEAVLRDAELLVSGEVVQEEITELE